MGPIGLAGGRHKAPARRWAVVIHVFLSGGDGGKNLGETQNQNPSCHLQHDLYPVLPPPSSRAIPLLFSRIVHLIMICSFSTNAGVPPIVGVFEVVKVSYTLPFSWALPILALYTKCHSTAVSDSVKHAPQP